MRCSRSTSIARSARSGVASGRRCSRSRTPYSVGRARERSRAHLAGGNMQEQLWAAPQLPLQLTLTLDVLHTVGPDVVRLSAWTTGTKGSGLVWSDSTDLEGIHWASVASERVCADVLHFAGAKWASPAKRQSQAPWKRHLFAH